MTVSVPQIRSIGDVFIVDWEKEKVNIKIDRIHEKSEGTSGEVLVTLRGGHLYHARINLLSPMAKKTIINELTKRVNGVDWHTMIEQAFTKTLIEYRRGEPVINIGNLPRRDIPRYRLKPFILEKQISSLYAHGGSCKTLIADLCAIMVQCGISLLGLNAVQGNVLILDWETDQDTANEKINAIKTGMGIEDERVPFYRRCYHLLTHDIAEIQRWIIEKNIILVIVDSAGMAAGFESDYHSVAIEMLRALRSLNISVLIIDHKPKSAETMFGSVYKFNECRAAFEVKATQEEGSNCVDVGIFHTKYNDTPKHKPLGFHIEFQGDENYTEAIVFTRKNVSDMPELEGRLSRKQRIINVLKSGAMEPKNIAEILNDKENAIRSELSRNKQLFIRTEEGWGLLHAEEYSP